MKSPGIEIALLFLFLFTGISTAQIRHPGHSFFFIQLTDPQFGMYENNKGFARETELFEKAVIEINRLKPAFVVITGDLVNDPDNKLQISEFRRIVAMIHSEIPVYLTPGNHDIGMIPDSVNINRYISNYGYDRFFFKYKGFRFIGINSTLIKFKTPGFEQEQFEWIRRELNRSRRKGHTILFCHYPFFIRSYDEPENYSNIDVINREKYLTLFAANGVEALFCGHLHDSVYAKYGEMELFTTSAVGKSHGLLLSGLRIVKIAGGSVVENKFYELDKIPASVTFD